MCGMKLLHTTDTDHICTCTFNISSHGIQEIGNIHDMRLSCGILQNCISAGHAGCHHNIDRSTHRNHIQINVFANQTIFRIGTNRTSTDIHPSTQSSETLQMQVNGSAANITSTRKRHFCFFVFSKKSSQQIIGCANLLDKLIVYADITDS